MLLIDLIWYISFISSFEVTQYLAYCWTVVRLSLAVNVHHRVPLEWVGNSVLLLLAGRLVGGHWEAWGIDWRVDWRDVWVLGDTDYVLIAEVSWLLLFGLGFYGLDWVKIRSHFDFTYLLVGIKVLWLLVESTIKALSSLCIEASIKTSLAVKTSIKATLPSLTSIESTLPALPAIEATIETSLLVLLLLMLLLVWLIVSPAVLELLLHLFCKLFLHIDFLLSRWSLEICCKFVSNHVNLLKGNSITFWKFHHVNIELFWGWAGREQLHYFRVRIFGDGLRVIEGFKDSLELVQGAKSKVIGSVYKRINKREPRFNLIWLVLIIGQEKSMTSQGYCTRHEQITSWIREILPWAYLRPFTTLSAMRISSTLFLDFPFIFITNSFYPLIISECFLSLLISKCILALRHAISICPLVAFAIFLGWSFPMLAKNL